jgi:hypothetical protein
MPVYSLPSRWSSRTRTLTVIGLIAPFTGSSSTSHHVIVALWHRHRESPVKRPCARRGRKVKSAACGRDIDDRAAAKLPSPAVPRGRREQ